MPELALFNQDSSCESSSSLKSEFCTKECSIPNKRNHNLCILSKNRMADTFQNRMHLCSTLYTSCGSSTRKLVLTVQKLCTFIVNVHLPARLSYQLQKLSTKYKSISLQYSPVLLTQQGLIRLKIHPESQNHCQSSGQIKLRKLRCWKNKIPISNQQSYTTSYHLFFNQVTIIST